MTVQILHEFPPSQFLEPWREFLKRVDIPSHYNAPEYFLDPLRSGFGPFAVVALDGDQARGVLTGFHLGKEVFSGLASRPQICVDETNADASLNALATGLIEEAGNAELVHVFTWASLKLPAFSAIGFRTQQLTGSVILDLTRGPEALFAEFAKDRRRNIRFAEKNGVEVREANSQQDIADAYEVYRSWRKTERKKVQSNWSFPDFEKTMGLRENRRLFLAIFQGRVIAFNIFRFYPAGLFESAANSSLEEFMHLKPNDLLQWRGIQWACAQGMRRHSLGGSHEFLLRFGGTVEPMLHYRLDRTLLRRHDVKDKVREKARSLLHRAPGPVGRVLKRVLRKVR